MDSENICDWCHMPIEFVGRVVTLDGMAFHHGCYTPEVKRWLRGQRHPTWRQTMHLNQRFMKNLREQFDGGAFTNKEAYLVYALWHSKSRETLEERLQDPWLQMNVRANLALATGRGLMESIRPGVHRIKE